VTGQTEKLAAVEAAVVAVQSDASAFQDAVTAQVSEVVTGFEVTGVKVTAVPKSVTVIIAIPAPTTTEAAGGIVVIIIIVVAVVVLLGGGFVMMKRKNSGVSSA